MFLTLWELFLLFCILTTVFIVHWYWTIPSNLPPGPIGLPIAGSYISVIKGSTQDLVLQKWVDTYGPLFRLYIGNELVIVLGDYDTIYEALVKQGDSFTDRVQFNAVTPEKFLHKGLVGAEGALWREQRRFALTILRDLGLGRPIMEGHIREEVDTLVTNMLDYKGQPFDPLLPLVNSVCYVVYGLVFGRVKSCERRDEIVKAFILGVEKLGEANFGFLTPMMLSARIASMLMFIPAVKAFKKQSEENLPVFEREINEIKATYDSSNEQPENFVHAFMKASESGEGQYFDDLQLMAAAADLFGAGTHTTGITLQWAVLFLGHHPQVQERVFEEIRENIGSHTLPTYGDRSKLPYTDAVMMEIQRLANLVPLGVLRRASAPTKLMGYDIPQGAVVAPLLTNVLHNEKYFDNPFEFRPERFLDANGRLVKDAKIIPFMLGKRMCIGESLARMEIFGFVTGMICRMRLFFPADKPKPTLQPIGGFFSIPQKYEICAEARKD